MRGKILFATGLAVGYVLGTRAGRERYEQMKRAAQGFWNDPRVQRRVDQVEDFVSDSAKKVVDQVTGAVRKSAPATSPAASSSVAAPPTPAATPAAARKPVAKRSTGSGTSS